MEYIQRKKLERVAKEEEKRKNKDEIQKKIIQRRI